jgi:hypothetical protein
MGIDYIQYEAALQSGKTQIAYVSKAPHKTWSLMVTFPVRDRPAKLLADLASSGWDEGRFPGASPCNGIQSLNLIYPGKGVFQEWTSKDREQAMSQCRKVLSKHGHDVVPHYELTMADCL